MPTLESPLVLALNHLLEAERWAADKLAPFAGESVELRAAPLPTLRLALAEGGRIAAAPAGGEPSLTINLKPGVLAALLRGEEQLMRQIEISGNARLASEVLLLVRHLRWDFEEDLSRIVGDAAAHRMAGAVRDLATWSADAGRRLAESFAEYAVEEQRLLVPRAELEGLASLNSQLRDALERLEKRVDRLGSPASRTLGQLAE